MTLPMRKCPGVNGLTTDRLSVIELNALVLERALFSSMYRPVWTSWGNKVSSLTVLKKLNFVLMHNISSTIVWGMIRRTTMTWEVSSNNDQKTFGWFVARRCMARIKNKQTLRHILSLFYNHVLYRILYQKDQQSQDLYEWKDTYV